MLFRRVFNIIQSHLKKKTWTADDTFTEPKITPELNPLKTKEAGYYANLELKPGAGFNEIKNAYKTLMKKYHPDKFHSNDEERKIAEKITTGLNEAYHYFEKKFN